MVQIGKVVRCCWNEVGRAHIAMDSQSKITCTPSRGRTRVHALCSGTYMSVQLVWVREHESVHAAGSGHQDEDVAVRLVHAHARKHVTPAHEAQAQVGARQRKV